MTKLHKYGMSPINQEVKLSDFSGDQLMEAAVAISIQIEAIEKDIERINKYPELGAMYADDLIRWKQRLDNLQTFYAQLLNACSLKEIERRITSN